MSFFVTEEVIYKIKSETDIVSLISEFVELKKSGSNFIGKCPFHNDKSPSFIVSPEKRIFRCFGCGESGDVISFLMKKQNMTFIETLEYLGEKIGVSINKNENYVQELKRNKLLYKINYDAMQFYYRNILIDKKPKEYIKSRQIGIELVNKFRIGYAGPMWDDLYKYLTDKGYNKEDMLDLGLILKNRSGGYYDRFRNRLMFPIFNIKNNIIGFGGRTVVGDKIKYMNSPDSCIFHKGENLYGLNELCKGKNSDKCILVEGYMDVIALFKNGFDFAVASLGTAFTKQQAKLIAKKCRKIFICYDGDDAGIKAASKAIDIFGEIEIYPKVVRLPDGLDPDEYIKLNGRDMFSELLENAVSTNTYKLSLIHAKYNLNNEEERLKYITEVSEFISKMNREVIRDEYIAKISNEVGIDKVSLKNDVEKMVSHKENKVYVNKRVSHTEAPKDKKERIILVVEIIRSILIDNRRLFVFQKIENFDGFFSISKTLKIIYDFMKNEIINGRVVEVNTLKTEFESNENMNKAIDKIANVKFFNYSKNQKSFNELINRIKIEVIKDKISSIKEDIDLLEKSDIQSEEKNNLLLEFAKYMNMLKSI